MNNNIEKTSCFFICLFLTQLMIAQSNSGYVILNNGLKQEVSIDDAWINNPMKIVTNKSENSTETTYSIDDLQEFKTTDGTVYKRATVFMDISSNSAEKFSITREPEFQEITIFLKTLVQGEASLYQYVGVGYLKYFYQTGDGDIEQLVYKRYKVEGDVLTNNDYKQTLSNELKCDGLQQRMFAKLKYSPKSLENIFNDYNDCIASANIYVQKSALDLDERKSFNVRAKAGLRINSFELEKEGTTVDLGSKTGIQLAFEGEYAYKSTNYNLSLLIEGVYFSYSQNRRIDTDNDNFDTYNLEYSAIELSFGPRYSIPIDLRSRVFANVLYTSPFHFVDALGSSSVENVTKFSTQGTISYGAGVEFNKISVEFRLQSARDILPDLDSKYKSISLSLGYRF